MPDERTPEERIDFASLERLSAEAPPPKQKQSSGVTKAVAFLVPLIVLAAVPWVLLTKVFKAPATKPTPAASATHSPEPSASPSQSPLAETGTYDVSGLHGTACLRVRKEPGTDADLVTCLTNGIRVESDGQTAEADKVVWLHITYGKASGWASAQYLKKAT